MNKVNKIKAFLCIYAMAVLPFIPISAQAREPLPIAEAVTRALAYSPVLEATRDQAGAAREKVGEAQSMKAPKLSIAVEEARTDSPMLAFGARLNQGRVTTADFEPSRLNDPSAVTNLRAGAQVMIPVSLAGMDRHAVGAAREGVGAAEQDIERVRQEVIFRVIETYLGAVLARESVAVTEKACEVSRENVRNAQSALDAQRTVESDLLQARVRHSENEENLLRRRNQERMALDSLATLMGIPAATDYELNMPFLQQVCTACSEEPVVLLGRALAQRPDYRKLARQNAALGHQEQMARGAVRPHLMVGATAGHDQRAPGSDGHGSTLVFGRIDWNVADGGEALHQARGARLQRDGLGRMAKALADGIHLEIRQAVTNINNSLERIRVSEEATKQGEESLRILRDRYSGGLAIMSDLLGAESSLLNHRMNHLQALYDHAISKARLKMALGELTPEHCEILTSTTQEITPSSPDGAIANGLAAFATFDAGVASFGVGTGSGNATGGVKGNWWEVFGGFKK